MNKLLYSILFIVFCLMSFRMNAQTLTRELLKGNKWIYVNDFFKFGPRG